MRPIKTVKIEVVSYDESNDTFAVQVPCPVVGRDTEENRIDVDGFDIPAGLLAHLSDHFDDPREFIGLILEIPSYA